MMPAGCIREKKKVKKTKKKNSLKKKYNKYVSLKMKVTYF